MVSKPGLDVAELYHHYTCVSYEFPGRMTDDLFFKWGRTKKHIQADDAPNAFLNNPMLIRDPF